MTQAPTHIRAKLQARLVTIAMMAIVASPVMAQAQSPSPPLPQAPTPAQPSQASADPAFNAAKAAYEVLSETERKAIQNDLVWSGDYNGVVDGGYGRRTHDGMLTFERRIKAKPDGILTATERKTLAELASRARDKVKFALLNDPKSGMRLGIPATMLTKRSEVDGGTQWSGAIGEATLTTRKLDAITLEALYEARASDTSQGRKVTYKVLRPDWFVIAGETGSRRFYTRYAKGENELRGYTISYEGSASAQWEPLVIAIANSLEPFPMAGAAGMSSAAATSASGTAPLAASTGNANALVIAAGKAMAPRALLEGCKSVSVAGRIARISAATAGDLALLEVEGLPAPSNISALTLRKDTISSGEAMVALGFGSGTLIGDNLSAAPGDVTVNADGSIAITSALQPGTGGAAVFDRSGRLIGLVALNPAAKVQVAGLVPAMRHRLISASIIAPVLAASASPALETGGTATLSIGEIAARSGSRIAKLTCTR
jgi:hypothetical protein